MSNALTTPGVLRLDTPAVIDATNMFKIRKVRLVPAGFAATATLKDGAGRLIASLSAPANGPADEKDWHAQSWGPVKGLELATLTGTGAVVYVYCQ
jgi:hypothetical protein